MAARALESRVLKFETTISNFESRVFEFESTLWKFESRVLTSRTALSKVVAFDSSRDDLLPRPRTARPRYGSRAFAR